MSSIQRVEVCQEHGDFTIVIFGVTYEHREYCPFCELIKDNEEALAKIEKLEEQVVDLTDENDDLKSEIKELEKNQ
jgi:hypothetical protein